MLSCKRQPLLSCKRQPLLSCKRQPLLSCKRQPLLSCKRQPLLSCKRQPFFCFKPCPAFMPPGKSGKSKNKDFTQILFCRKKQKNKDFTNISPCRKKITGHSKKQSHQGAKAFFIRKQKLPPLKIEKFRKILFHQKPLQNPGIKCLDRMEF